MARAYGRRAGGLGFDSRLKGTQKPCGGREPSDYVIFPMAVKRVSYTLIYDTKQRTIQNISLLYTLELDVDPFPTDAVHFQENNQ